MAEELIQKYDDLHLAGRENPQILEGLLAANEQYPNNVEIMWRISRAYYDRNELSSDKAVKKDFVEKGFNMINKANEVNANHWAVHKWMAIMYSALGDHVSSKEKIANAFKIKEHALKALELKPNDPTTLHLLGRWCMTIANISWIERGIASALFGTPPTSSFEEALDYFLKAHAVGSTDPTTLRNTIFIGDCYTQLKNGAKAKEYYTLAAETVPKNDFDKTLIQEAKSKIK
ncbi:hypothetical protein DLAC_06278 [Tieghemostelium lacteum]|uniref:Regulator of microtubule dynamics protein 1 n=1 Tax=Tieghemostelium lacteum TaxID=361077 RepID=A0A151ZEJ6_TIELA|nr:hypothetical protein DLAC_06278 [Tieghemostelium lacteum]|eukprot:KYQ92314.1 hypothetical protein DLAC_06278 [Tieghemostelium lacteum]